MTSVPHNPWHHTAIERRFVDTPAGQVHVRLSRADADPDSRPFVMLHPSPASSISLAPMICEMGAFRKTFALDTLGFGDSAAPPKADPTASDYAGWALAAIDALGLAQFDLYGSHTGSHLAVEMAIAHPERVGRLVLDGIPLWDAQMKAKLLANYAPQREPDIIGSQFNWAWHFIRDQSIYFPYFEPTSENFRHQDLRGAERLHVSTVEVLKALTTYHYGYAAAFTHRDKERLPLLTQETLVTASVSDPLRGNADQGASLIPAGQLWLSPASGEAGALRTKVRGINQFLSEGTVP